MDRRRARGLFVHGLVAPTVTIGVVVGLASVTGVNVGLAILALSVVAAAAFTLALLADTRGMRSGVDRGGGAADGRDPVQVRNELATEPDVPAGDRRVVTRYTGGLFALAAVLVLYLGGLFGG